MHSDSARSATPPSPASPRPRAARFTRAVAERSTAWETRHVHSPAARRVLKGAVDFTSGIAAVWVAVMASDALGDVGTFATAALALLVGTVLVGLALATDSYRTMWRYTSVQEVAAVSFSIVLVGLLVGALAGLRLVALSADTVILIALLALVFELGVRLLRRWQLAEVRRRDAPLPISAAPPRLHRILIAGAGDRAQRISRDLAQVAPGTVALAGYLDDDPAKAGALIAGAPVLGPLADVLPIAERHQVDEVIVAIPTADPERIRAFVRHVEDAGLRVRVVGGIERFVAGGALHHPGDATLAQIIAPGAGRGPAPDGAGRLVLVTGGAGYVGSHVTRLLLARGYRVRILDRLDYGTHGIDALAGDSRLELLQGDICNTRDLSRALRGVDGVIALAAIVGDPACNLDPEETVNLNYTATKLLMDSGNFYGVRRLVFASSCSVYGASADALLTERSRLNPVSLYARTRVLSENIIFDRYGRIEPVVLRLSTVFGLSPRMRFDLVVNTLTARAVVDRRIAIFGGNQWRPNAHVRDVARAFVTALEAPRDAVAGEIFNVGGDGLNHRISELGDIVARVVGGVEVMRQDEVTDPRDYRVSFEKIRRVLGFEPEWTVAQGVEEIAQAVRSEAALQRHLDPRFHNVQALKETFAHPHRRRTDRLPAPSLAVGAGAP